MKKLSNRTNRKIGILRGKGTSFQRAVWKQIIKIPGGKTKTYKEIAAAVGKPRAYRAVGQACRKNPLPVSIPCHRVVGKGGRLGGYSGGRKNKLMLLRREKDSQQK